ncbi:MAG: thioredoxin domain-containing protein [Nitrospinaceae bacterium]
MESPTHTNRLAREKSPYLLQHAHNPVDWYPWGPEAFALARQTKKPLLVSIGYATCHWCHVMERESFEDPGTAEIINQYFVPVKVDREERPDVDGIYMKAVQALGQQGGWPLNVFVTPEGIPFYGGTYFPPVGRYNLPSFTDVLKFLHKTWQEEPEKVEKQSRALIDHLRQTGERQAPKGDAAAKLQGFHGEDKTAEAYEKFYDPLHHGFKFQAQNKFPPCMGLSLLLRRHHRTGHGKSLEMVENTLQAMRRGGIYDQIGGGLSRYSTDYRWLVPHFEKMLYDNALFVTSLVECHQVTGTRAYRQFAEDVLEYIDRDMTHPDGGFYSAEDADSEGVEGKFYVWTQQEIEDILGRETASVAIPFFNVSPGGNWEGKNILHVTRSQETLAREQGLRGDYVEDALDGARRALLAARQQRVRPLLDDKILTSWNGLMISAMARAGRVFKDPDRVGKARRAMEFVWDRLRTADGKLLRRWREGEARYDGYLFDYTAIALAAAELYEATFDPEFALRARGLMQAVEDRFAGPGAYFETTKDGEDLIMRQVSGYDGVEPSGNSNACMVLLKLAAWFQEPAYEEKAETLFRSFQDDLTEYGLNSPFMMQALHLYAGGKKEVALIGVRGHPSTGELLDGVSRGFFPNAVFAFAHEDDPGKDRLPLLAGKKAVQGRAAAYVCQRGTCLPPVTSMQELHNLLQYP